MPEELIFGLLSNFYRGADRDERIAYDRKVSNIMRILKSVSLTIIITYILGLIWYRLSDNWQRYLMIPAEQNTETVA